MLLLVHFNSQGKLQRFKFRAPPSVVQTNKQKPTMSTVRRVTLSGGAEYESSEAWGCLVWSSAGAMDHCAESAPVLAESC